VDGDSYEDLVVAANISDAFSWFKTTVTLGFEQLAEQTLNIYPVPVLNQLNLIMPESVSSISYRLLNAAGVLVLSGQLDGFRGVLDLSTISSGTYLLICETAEGSYSKKIVKR
jgi:hypothetical protein